MKLKGNKCVQIIKRGETDFPNCLLEFDDPAEQLYVVSKDEVDRSFWRRKMITVVGSRSNSEKGVMLLKEIIPRLVRLGYGIVSGLALGIDSLAHKITLGCGGLAVAVLPGGYEDIYPYSSRPLAEMILSAGGLLVTEFGAVHRIVKNDFLRRNRIMVGLGVEVVVIEAERFSGSVATANMAMELGKPVWCLRGMGAGTDELLDDGAYNIGDDTNW